MSAIRWNVRDRVNGTSIMIAGPMNHKEREALRAVIKNVSALGVVRGGR